MKTLCLAWILIAGSLAQPVLAQTRQPDRSYPPKIAGARAETYKTVADTKLKLYVFEPKGHKPNSPRPAIVFFYGGGFVAGSPAQFAKHCEYLATRGMVAITADYRVKNRHGTTPTDSVEDGKDAMRFVRSNAKRLGVDSHRIVAAGGSAGGLIAACVGVIPSAGNSKAETSYTPNAMLLFNPAIMGTTVVERTDPDGSPSFKKQIMPFHHVREDLPPSMMFYGAHDKFVKGAKEFQQAARGKGNRCEVLTWEGVGHGFFNLGRNDNKEFIATLKAADKFLESLAYVRGEPAVDQFMGDAQSGATKTDAKDPRPSKRPKTSENDRRKSRQKAKERSIAMFLRQFDKDGDGVLDNTELPEALSSHLATLDTDKDGKLTTAELLKMRGRPGPKGEIVTGAAPGERYDDTLEVGQVAPDFTLLDPDGKRKVTLSSFQGDRPVVLIFGSYT